MNRLEFARIAFNGIGLVTVVCIILLLVFVLPRFIARSSAFEAGYNYAMTELRAGRKSPYDLEAETLGFGDRTEFDKGIDAAIDDVVRGGRIKDNRLY